MAAQSRDGGDAGGLVASNFIVPFGARRLVAERRLLPE
jgi:hypothetical protein